MYLQELSWAVAILTFLGGIAVFLFRQIVIVPLQRSIDTLNATLKDFKMGTDKELEIHDEKIGLLEIKATRHDEQIKTLFQKGGIKK